MTGEFQQRVSHAGPVCRRALGTRDRVHTGTPFTVSMARGQSPLAALATPGLAKRGSGRLGRYIREYLRPKSLICAQIRLTNSDHLCDSIGAVIDVYGRLFRPV